jgi:hypothetical protein
MIEFYTIAVHRHRPDSEQATVMAWLITNQHDPHAVRQMRWTGDTLEIETIDRKANGQPKTIVRGGQLQISTSLVRIKMDEPPPWWPRARPTGSL